MGVEALRTTGARRGVAGRYDRSVRVFSVDVATPFQEGSESWAFSVKTSKPRKATRRTWLHVLEGACDVPEAATMGSKYVPHSNTQLQCNHAIETEVTLDFEGEVTQGQTRKVPEDGLRGEWHLVGTSTCVARSMSVIIRR